MPPDMYRVFNFKIDEHEFPYIDYPSKDYYDSLIVEWATLCKLEARNPTGRRNFRCVHCCRVFTSKHRVNSHRYVNGCEEARLPDGGPAALYPYPNLKIGQGKFVEMLAKGKGVHFDGVAREGMAVGKTCRGELGQEGQRNLSADEDDEDSDFEKILPKKACGTSNVTDAGQAKDRATSRTFTPLPVLPRYTCGSPKGARIGTVPRKRTCRASASVVRGSGANDGDRRTVGGVVTNAAGANLGEGVDPDIAASYAMGEKHGGCTTRAQRRATYSCGRASAADEQQQSEETQDLRKRTPAPRDLNRGKKTRFVRQAAKKVNDRCNTGSSFLCVVVD